MNKKEGRAVKQKSPKKAEEYFERESNQSPIFSVPSGRNETLMKIIKRLGWHPLKRRW